MRLRFALLVSLLWLTSARTRADVVVLACAAECTAEQVQGLKLELRGYGALVVVRPAPAEFTRSARGPDARRHQRTTAGRGH
ncbi:MAG TPA: hypothetical protein VFZ61_26350, partial [Polyangiales bacterium]